VELPYKGKSDHWEKKYATATSIGVLSVAFLRLGLPNLTAFKLRTNAASGGVIAKHGFPYDREITHGGQSHGLYRLRGNT
jgi:RimJ/RimL family protein N-acetyltransferase